MSHVEEFRKGMKLCLANANKWLNESNELYHKRSYGHYCALLIHGAEALAQAYVYWEVIHGIEEPDAENVIKAFKNHRPKIDTLFGILGGIYKLDKILEHKGDYSFKTDYTEKELEKGYKELLTASKSFYRGMMGLRNLGIHVDYDSDTYVFKSPMDIKKEVADVLGVLVFVFYFGANLIFKASKKEIEGWKKTHRHLFGLRLEENKQK